MNHVENTHLPHRTFAIPGLIAAAILITSPAQADIANGWSGSISGGIPAITRESSTGKLFWCNQHMVLRKACRIVDISASKRVAIVNQPKPEANCPNGLWGIVDRKSGTSRTVVPDNNNKVSFADYCRGNFRLGFVKTQDPNVLAKVVVYFNNKVVDSLEYIAE
ncbi:hypothetical protein [Pantoea ananatis]|uniref:hypothetical protein n=1 Tax=Pantoea ananas TaxID=553 RepID=UPI0021F6D43C|nr:hypothetical protein [Pantoea ananatis]MCW0329865.1 hypothetical protein [Pantoea ananatis]